MMREIGDNIVELSLIALAAFFSVGYLIVQLEEQTNMMYEACIAADKQWIKGDCVK